MLFVYEVEIPMTSDDDLDVTDDILITINLFLLSIRRFHLINNALPPAASSLFRPQRWLPGVLIILSCLPSQHLEMSFLASTTRLWIPHPRRPTQPQMQTLPPPHPTDSPALEAISRAPKAKDRHSDVRRSERMIDRRLARTLVGYRGTIERGG